MRKPGKEYAPDTIAIRDRFSTLSGERVSNGESVYWQVDTVDRHE